jgi:hypothetical protein
MQSLKSLVSPENYQLVLALAASFLAAIKALAIFFGSCSMVVAALKKALPLLNRWAAHTASKRDDGLVEGFSIVLGVTATFLEKAKHWLELAALNKFWNEEIITIEREQK